jgi:hypothetical protein
VDSLVDIHLEVVLAAGASSLDEVGAFFEEVFEAVASSWGVCFAEVVVGVVFGAMGELVEHLEQEVQISWPQELQISLLQEMQTSSLQE